MTAAVLDAAQVIARGGRRFRVARHPSSDDGARAFLGGAEAATLAFFDAALPRCVRMIDCGAYVGFMSLYAALHGAEVHAVEASPAHRALLDANIALNPGLAERIQVHGVAIGARDGKATLFRKGDADSGTSVFEMVERDGVRRGKPDATVPMREAPGFLAGLGLDSATLLKIDVEGAEYAILPAIADLLARTQPFLQVSFHPFNLVGADPYRTTLMRVRAALDAAEALAAYRFIYLPRAIGDGGAGWICVDPGKRLDFLRNYLLEPKSIQRIASPQFGFVDAVGFSRMRLPELEGTPLPS